MFSIYNELRRQKISSFTKRGQVYCWFAKNLLSFFLMTLFVLSSESNFLFGTKEVQFLVFRS